MTQSRLLLMAACLALAVARVSAREPKAPPPPVPEGDSVQAGAIRTVPHPSGRGTMTLYVGKYGEAIEIPYDWSAKVVTRGEIEAVYFHRNFSDDQRRVPFNPKPSDYKAENFAPLELIELVVVPKKAPGGLHSLAEMRSAKEKEAAAAGTDAEISVEKNEFAWPRGTFRVQTSKPHRLEQLYTESKKEFFILTSAAQPRPAESRPGEERAEDYRYTIQSAEASLRRHVIGFFDPAHPGFSGELFVPMPAESEDVLSSFKTARFIGLFGTLAAVMLLLAFWPGTTAGARRARLWGRSVFMGAHLTGTVGFLVTYLPIALANFRWRCATDAMLILMVLAPVVSGLAARALGFRAGRVAASTGGLAVVLAIPLLRGRPDDTLEAGTWVLGNTALLYAAGIAFGVAFALSCGQSSRAEKSR